MILCLTPLSHHRPLSVSAFVTHGVFPNASWKKFKADLGEGASSSHGFRYFWISDSCPAAKDVDGHAPFEVLSLATSIANALQI